MKRADDDRSLMQAGIGTAGGNLIFPAISTYS